MMQQDKLITWHACMRFWRAGSFARGYRSVASGAVGDVRLGRRHWRSRACLKRWATGDHNKEGRPSSFLEFR